MPVIRKRTISEEVSMLSDVRSKMFSEHFKPTNGDRIRAMSDEELARWLSICGCPDAFSMVVDCESGKCEECWSAWLQQTSDHFREATKKEDA